MRAPFAAIVLIAFAITGCATAAACECCIASTGLMTAQIHSKHLEVSL